MKLYDSRRMKSEKGFPQTHYVFLKLDQNGKGGNNIFQK